MQTCTMVIQKERFDFFKLRCIVFNGKDATDLGGPRRKFFKLVMRGVCQELGVFEGSSDNLVFSHDHSVISSQKPCLAGQLLSRSILHDGPGLHSSSEDVYYLMMDMHDDINPMRAALAIADDGAAAVARALMDVHDDSDHSLEEFKSHHMEWLINQGISLGFRKNQISKEALMMQIIKQALLYRVKESIGLFIAGIDSVGGLLSGYVRANPKAFVPVFCDKSAP